MAAHAEDASVPAERLCDALMGILEQEDHEMPLTDAQMATHCCVSLVQLRAARRFLDVPASQGRRKRYRAAAGPVARASAIPTDAEISLREAREMQLQQDEEFRQTVQQDRLLQQVAAAQAAEVARAAQAALAESQQVAAVAQARLAEVAAVEARRAAKGKARANPADALVGAPARSSGQVARDELRRARLRALCPEQLGLLEAQLSTRTDRVP